MSAQPSLAERTQALADALAAAAGRLAPQVLAPAQAALERARERGQLSAEHTVIALAGGTGAGKSSVFNAIVGESVARTSQQRPTTAHPLAVVAESPELTSIGGAAELLAWLDVPERRDVPVSARHPSGLVLLDLPDHDSVVAAHRERADHVTERADLLVWVTNPQKYADGVLHAQYLVPLAGRDLRVLVVLNQADRLDSGEVTPVLADLKRLVRADGLDAEVLAVSALTGTGIDELEAVIARAVRERKAATQRLVAEVRAAAEDLLAATGGPAGKSGESGESSAPLRATRGQLITALEDVAGVPLVVDAVERASLRDAVAQTGWPPTRWVQRFRSDPLRTLGLRTALPGAAPGRTPSSSSIKSETGATAAEASRELRRTSIPAASAATQARLANAARDYVTAASATLPAGWGEDVTARAVADVRGAADALDVAVARSVTLRPARWWRVVGAVQWLVLAAMVGGLAWLAVLALLAYFQLPVLEPPVATIGPVSWPWPTLLALGGAAVGIGVAALSRVFARIGARRRAAAVARDLRRSVSALASERLVGQVDAELAALAAIRENAARAAR